MRPRTERRIVIARLLMLWVFLVSVYFLWEADRYRGLYALLAEFQFNYLGQHWPVLTFALLLILFGSPAAWLLRSRRRTGDAAPGETVGSAASLQTSTNFRRVLFGFSGGLAGAALITLLWTLTLPKVTPPTETIAVGSAQSVTPPLGPVTLNGEILYQRTSAFAQYMLVKRRGVRFAPIVAPGSKDGHLRYFVELLPDDPTVPLEARDIDHRSGVLMRNNLPGSIVRLYRYAGYRVERPFYVLYASSSTIRWPYYVTAVQLGLAALVTLIAALVQHRHVRQISPPRNSRRRRST